MGRPLHQPQARSGVADEEKFVLIDRSSFVLLCLSRELSHQNSRWTGEKQEEYDEVADSLISMVMDEQLSAPELQARYARFVYEQADRNKADACRVLGIDDRTLRCHWAGR
jgi:hypothetical protein